MNTTQNTQIESDSESVFARDSDETVYVIKASQVQAHQALEAMKELRRIVNSGDCEYAIKAQRDAKTETVRDIEADVLANIIRKIQETAKKVRTESFELCDIRQQEIKEGHV